MLTQDDTLIEELSLFTKSYRIRNVLWNIFLIMITIAMIGGGIYLLANNTILFYIWLPLFLFSSCMLVYILFCIRGIIYNGVDHDKLVLNGKTFEIYSQKTCCCYTIQYHLMSFDEFSYADIKTDRGGSKFGRLRVQRVLGKLPKTVRFSESFKRQNDINFLEQNVKNINDFFHGFDRIRCDYLITGLSKDTFGKRRSIPFSIIDLIVDFAWRRIENKSLKR